MFQYIYSSLFPKYFCRVDDYSVKNKLAFEVAHAAYQNQQNVIFQLPEQQQPIVKIKQEQIDDKKFEVVEEKIMPPSVKPVKERKNVKNDKLLLKKKKEMKKKIRLLSKLEQNDLRMKCLNSNVNK